MDNSPYIGLNKNRNPSRHPQALPSLDQLTAERDASRKLFRQHNLRANKKFRVVKKLSSEDCQGKRHSGMFVLATKKSVRSVLQEPWCIQSAMVYKIAANIVTLEYTPVACDRFKVTIGLLKQSALNVR